MPDLTNEQLTIALAAVAGVALISLIAAFVAMRKARKARKEYMILRGDSGPRDLLSAVGQAMRRVDEVSERVEHVSKEQTEQAALSRYAVQRFGLVRYDAFEDMGGQLSFSAALLDDHGDGIVITSINGRTETRTYAKPIKRLDSEHNLSAEERAALEQAASGDDRVAGKRASATR
ncbi:MAG: DUF4446 family protein [Actinomycetota bacterium]